jgi:hypothetical protein
MAEIAIQTTQDISPNAGAMFIALTVTPTHASTNTVVVPANRGNAVTAAILVNNVDGGIPKACTWTGRTITLTGVASGGVSDEHTLLVFMK